MGTITLTFYPQLELAHLQGHGDISESMILKDLRKLPLHPEWQSSYNTLVDLDGAVLRHTPARLSDEQDSPRPRSKPRKQAKLPISKWAICIANSQAGHLLADRLRANGGVIVDVFHHHHEALHFLDLSLPQWHAAKIPNETEQRWVPVEK